MWCSRAPWWGSCAAGHNSSSRPTTSCSTARSRPTSARCATSAATCRCSSRRRPSCSMPRARRSVASTRATFLLACRLARRLRDDAEDLLVEEAADRARRPCARGAGARIGAARARHAASAPSSTESAKDLLDRAPRTAALADRARRGALCLAVPPDPRLPRVHRPDADGLSARSAPAARGRAPRGGPGRAAVAARRRPRLLHALALLRSLPRGLRVAPSQLRNFMEAPVPSSP